MTGGRYRIYSQCPQHFNNYFRFSCFPLILKALLHEIFSAFHRMRGESEEQSINSRLIWQRIREESERESNGRITRESISESISETYSPLQEIYSIHARHLPGDYQNRFGTLSTVVSCSILLAIPETCQA